MPFLAIDEATATPVEVELGVPLVSEGKTLLDFRGEVDVRVGGRPDILEGRYDSAINDAYVDVCTSLDIDELKASFSFDLVAGQSFYLLPKEVATILNLAIILPESVNIDKGYPLDKTDLSTYRRLELYAGDPQMFFKFKRVLVVYPTPDAVRTVALDCRIKPQPMVEPEDSPVIPWEWHKAITMAATSEIFNSSMEFVKGAAWQNQKVSYMRDRTDFEAAEDENRVVGSAAPQRLRDVRNSVVRRRRYYEDTDDF